MPLTSCSPRRSSLSCCVQPEGPSPSGYRPSAGAGPGAVVTSCSTGAQRHSHPVSKPASDCSPAAVLNALTYYVLDSHTATALRSLPSPPTATPNARGQEGGPQGARDQLA
eukprot:2301929-Rhodomonas_salina.5